MLKRLGIVLFAVLLVSFVVAPCGAAQLVQDGGFEGPPLGTFTGSPWTVTPSLLFSNIAVNTADPHTGTYAASFGAAAGLGPQEMIPSRRRWLRLRGSHIPSVFGWHTLPVYYQMTLVRIGMGLP